MEEILVRGEGTVTWRGRVLRCALGAGGLSAHKIEGDRTTPIGAHPLRVVYYRADRVNRPATVLPVAALAVDDGWCDDPTDPMYNRPVKLPYRARCETLYRADTIYDVIITLGYNDAPVVPYRGSAVFLHVARADFAPTLGCVALAVSDLLAILSECSPATVLRVTP
ncbi:MAG: hypothetical protein FJX56_14945 [Alphaproteobacteria bacterium]|nr:hypothetical protein [Alphaproteobacteria bacterium]